VDSKRQAKIHSRQLVTATQQLRALLVVAAPQH
jgi:hypothetical protein